jgi:methyl-accepting chemotaxis protein
MSFLNNLKIIFKIGLIVGLLALVAAGGIGFNSMSMKEAGAAYADLIVRVDRSAVVAARGGRDAEAYLSNVYQLAAETTDEGNVKLLAMTNDSRKGYLAKMELVRKALPEKATAIDPVVKDFSKAFAVCQPIVEFASKATTPEDVIKANAWLKRECNPVIDGALDDQRKLVDNLTAYAAAQATELGDHTNTVIVTVLTTAGLGLLVGLALAMWIGIKGLSQPIERLKTTMEAFAANDLTSDFPGKERRDELGAMARTAEVFKTNATDMERMRAEQQASEQRTAQQRRTDMHRLANEFESAIGQLIENVSSVSTELEASANTLSSTATHSQELTTMVAAASEQASTNVRSVASATEELSRRPSTKSADRFRTPRG